MNSFYVLMKGQGEGCDYTIGCNMLYEKLKSTTIDEAQEEVDQMIEDRGGIDSDDPGWEEIILLQVENEFKRVIPKQKWI